MKRPFTSILLILIALIQSGIAQTTERLSYEVTLMGKKIGNTIVEKTLKEDGSIEYRLSNSTEAKVLMVHKKSNIYSTALYKNGVMLNSFCTAENEEGKKKTVYIKNGDGYDMTLDNKKIRIKRVINHSSLMLYFMEPQNLANIFSERLGTFFYLEKVGKHEYLSIVNNVTSYYRYLDGRLNELEMSRPLGSIFLRLVQN